MASFNRVIIMGNLTADPEVRAVGSGSVTTFTLAVNEKWKDKDGQWQERASFIGCEMWGPRGEAFAQYHTKGQPAFIEGKLRQDSWEKDGQKQTKTKVVAESFEFVGGKGEQSVARNTTSNGLKKGPPKSSHGVSIDDGIDPSEIPF